MQCSLKAGEGTYVCSAFQNHKDFISLKCEVLTNWYNAFIAIMVMVTNEHYLMCQMGNGEGKVGETKRSEKVSKRPERKIASLNYEGWGIWRRLVRMERGIASRKSEII